nr:radical SAM family heme chaperone HemW [Ktedonobacterales bacterium]
MNETLTRAPAQLDVAWLDTISLYIHIPFCHKKCHYCDFNSYAGMLGWRTKYVAALVREITLLGEATRQADGTRRVCRTIFFGGGTPSLLRATEVAAILAAANEAFAVVADAEITLEANPGTLEYHHLAELRATGVNRLSMGAQSFDAGLLQWMGRIHSPEEITMAVHAARAGGFDNLNLDFIFALPDQTMVQWTDTLERAIALEPNHLSLYSLIVEPTTPLFDWVEAGQVAPASEDSAADMYVAAQERLAGAGYAQYEISNWARDGRRSEHNLTYWRNLPYLGVGAGAFSYYEQRRYSNVRGVGEYVRAIADWSPDGPVGAVGGPVVESDTASRATEMSQTVILALRLNEGLDLAHFAARFGNPFEAVFAAQAADPLRWGLLEYAEGALRLTERGRLVGN